MFKIKVSHWPRRFVVISLPAKEYWGLSPMGGICHYWDTPHKWQNPTQVWQNSNVTFLTPYVTNPAHKWQNHFWRFRNGYIDIHIYISITEPSKMSLSYMGGICHIWGMLPISDKTQPIFDKPQMYLLWPHMWQIPPINDKLHFVIFVMLTP